MCRNISFDYVKMYCIVVCTYYNSVQHTISTFLNIYISLETLHIYVDFEYSIVCVLHLEPTGQVLVEGQVINLNSRLFLYEQKLNNSGST